MRRSKLYYLVKIKNNYLNYLNLNTDPLRLRNTCSPKESIYYTKQDIQNLLKLHPDIEIEIVNIWAKP
jgi:hypothetical protein